MVLDILCVIRGALTGYRLRFYFLGMLGGLFVLNTAQSIQGRSSASDPSRRVSLYVSIVDKEGKPVSKVTSQDLTVLEDSKPQVVTTLQFEGATPVSLGVL